MGAKVRIGLNGFGRVGRAIFRIAQSRNFEIPIINDINPDNWNMAYLLKYDSVYGQYQGPVSANNAGLMVDNNQIAITHHRNISNVPWQQNGVSIVIDATGSAGNLSQYKEIDSSVRNIIVTNALDGPDIKPIIFGCNSEEVESSEHRVYSSSICDAIALAPIVKLLSDNVGIENGNLVTIHPWLTNQNVLDNPYSNWDSRGEQYSNFSLGRGATTNLIPKATTAVKAASKVILGLEDILGSFSYRVPTSIVCSATLTFNAKRNTSVEMIHEMFSVSERNQKYRIFKENSEPLVSGDFKGEEHSAVIDHRWTLVKDRKYVRLVYWYDNEWGYSSRAVDLAWLLIQKQGVLRKAA